MSVSAENRVYFGALYSTELILLHCNDFIRCENKGRSEILAGLGHALGATAAHELGHQAGLHYAFDTACDDCYDGAAATALTHFFGARHWSDRALAPMRAVLPTDDSHVVTQ